MRDLDTARHLAQIHADAVYCPAVVEQFFTAPAAPVTAIMICEPQTHAAVQNRIGRMHISFFDAHKALSRMMGPSGLEAGRVADYFAEVIAEARASGSGGPLRIYGELADLLCRQDNYAAALELEGLASQLLSAEPEALILCGYAAENFGTEEGAAQFGRICARHDHVVRAENFAPPRQDAKVEEKHGPGDRGLLQQTVYIIDDDPSVRGALLRFLGMKGMKARGFETAERFLADLPGLGPGALIVDVQLPGMSGLKLLDLVARAGIDWPAVVISGAHEGHEDAVARALGPGRYLRKPFDPQALLRALGAAGIT